MQVNEHGQLRQIVFMKIADSQDKSPSPVLHGNFTRNMNYNINMLKVDNSSTGIIRRKNNMSQVVMTDEEILKQLNSDYVNSFIHGNAQRYEEILSPDFVSITPSG